MNSHKERYPPWRRRQEAKIKVAWKEVSQIPGLQRAVMKKGGPRNYNKLHIPDALKTDKQRLMALSSHLKRYTREMQGRRINQLFSTEPSNNVRTVPPRLETEQYWKSIWKKETTNNNNAQWQV